VGAPEIPPDPIAFFDSAVTAFGAVSAHAGATGAQFFQFGPYTIRVDIAGDEPRRRMTRALQHLAAAPTAVPALTVLMWDDASTGGSMPPPPWRWDRARGRGEIYEYNTRRICTAYNFDGGVLTVLDVERRLAVCWTRDARRLPSYEISAPLRTLLNWFATSNGAQVAHAAAVGTPAGGVLLAGKGGSGKSTSVLACLGTNLGYVGDDYCLLTANPEPWAYSLYCSAKVDAGGLRRFPHLMSAVCNSDRAPEEKAVLFLDRLWGDHLISGCPLLAILLPCVRPGARTRLARATPVDGLRALALSTMAQLPRAGQGTVAFFSRLVHAVPCYHLELGPEVAEVPDVIRDVIVRDAAARRAVR
jgi:hypothetical protein